MPRENIKDQRKQQLIQATMDSIAKRGLSETTITHICKGARLSRGIVNFYFTSKEKMMQGVLVHLLAEYAAIWKLAREKAGPDKQAQLEAIIRAQFDRRLCSAKRLNVLSAFWGHAASHEPYRACFAASDAEITEALAACWDGPQPEAFAGQCFALIRGLWLRYLLAPKATDREALANEALSFAAERREPLKLVGGHAPGVSMRKPSRRRETSDAQMDIEDLFANG